MTSGVKASKEVIELFQRMKVPGKLARIRVAVLKIDEEKGEIVEDKIITDPELEDGDAYVCMTSCLEPLNCRYLLYDCHFTNSISAKEDLVCILWCDEDAKTKEKMRYASSKDSLRKLTTGVKHNFEVNCKGDISSRKAFAEMLGDDVTVVEGKEV